MLKALLANGGSFPYGGCSMHIMAEMIHITRHIYQVGTTCRVAVCSSPRLRALKILTFLNRIVLPREWTSTMAPLQDKCEATPYKDIAELVLSDMGQPINELFDNFDPVPIGVASLAQVHVGHHKASGKKVAVKVCTGKVLTGGAYFGCRFNILTWLNSSILT